MSISSRRASAESAGGGRRLALWYDNVIEHRAMIRWRQLNRPQLRLSREPRNFDGFTSRFKASSTDSTNSTATLVATTRVGKSKRRSQKGDGSSLKKGYLVSEQRTIQCQEEARLRLLSPTADSSGYATDRFPPRQHAQDISFGESNKDNVNKLKDEASANNLGLVNVTSTHHVRHQRDHQVTLMVFDQLMEIILWCTTGVEAHLDDTHQARTQDMEAKLF